MRPTGSCRCCWFTSRFVYGPRIAKAGYSRLAGFAYEAHATELQLPRDKRHWQFRYLRQQLPLLFCEQTTGQRFAHRQPNKSKVGVAVAGATGDADLTSLTSIKLVYRLSLTIENVAPTEM